MRKHTLETTTDAENMATVMGFIESCVEGIGNPKAAH